MSPREKKTASKNTGPAVTRTSSKGTLRPTKVTVPRIKRALADIGVRASDRPDGSLLTLTDNSIISFFVFAGMLNVSIQWMSNASSHLEEALCVVVDSWNVNDSTVAAGIIVSPQEDMARLCGAMRLPVEVGLTDDQLEHFLRDAIDGCGFFERFLEEAFPQTRFDALAQQAGIRIPDPAEEILAELDGQPEDAVAQLVEQARAVADTDMEQAVTLLSQASEIARAADLDPVSTGINDAFAAMMEKTLDHPGIQGTQEAALGQAVLEELRTESREQGGDEPLSGATGGPAVPEGGHQHDHGIREIQDLEDEMLRLFGAGNADSAASGLPWITFPLVLEALSDDYDFIEKNGAAVLSIGDNGQEMVVTVEGTELVVTSRWDGVDWEAHDISGPLTLNEWNVGNHALTLHSGMAGRVGDAAATGEENRPNAAEPSSTELHDFLDEIIARASWCMGAGATKDQIADMLATAADEVESIDDFLRAELEMFDTIDIDADK